MHQRRRREPRLRPRRVQGALRAAPASIFGRGPLSRLLSRIARWGPGLSGAARGAAAQPLVTALRCRTARKSPHRIIPAGALTCGGPFAGGADLHLRGRHTPPSRRVGDLSPTDCVRHLQVPGYLPARLRSGSAAPGDGPGNRAPRPLCSRQRPRSRAPRSSREPNPAARGGHRCPHPA